MRGFLPPGKCLAPSASSIGYITCRETRSCPFFPGHVFLSIVRGGSAPPRGLAHGHPFSPNYEDIGADFFCPIRFSPKAPSAPNIMETEPPCFSPTLPSKESPPPHKVPLPQKDCRDPLVSIATRRIFPLCVTRSFMRPAARVSELELILLPGGSPFPVDAR